MAYYLDLADTRLRSWSNLYCKAQFCLCGCVLNTAKLLGVQMLNQMRLITTSNLRHKRLSLYDDVAITDEFSNIHFLKEKSGFWLNISHHPTYKLQDISFF